MGKQSCRTCKLYDLQSIITETGRLRRGKSARCLWVSTETYPDSISWRDKRPQPMWMEPKDGANCPCFTALDEGQ